MSGSAVASLGLTLCWRAPKKDLWAADLWARLLTWTRVFAGYLPAKAPPAEAMGRLIGP